VEELSIAGCGALAQEGANTRNNVLGLKAVGGYIEIAMPSGVLELDVLFVQVRLRPAPPPAPPDGVDGGIKIDKHIGLRPLPQVRYV
jgi:hypothetical protein